MYIYEYIGPEKDKLNNVLSYYGHFWWVESIKVNLKLHNSRLVGRNIWKRPRVPTKGILLSHPANEDYAINVKAVRSAIIPGHLDEISYAGQIMKIATEHAYHKYLYLSGITLLTRKL